MREGPHAANQHEAWRGDLQRKSPHFRASVLRALVGCPFLSFLVSGHFVSGQSIQYTFDNMKFPNQCFPASDWMLMERLRMSQICNQYLVIPCLSLAIIARQPQRSATHLLKSQFPAQTSTFNSTKMCPSSCPTLRPRKAVKAS
jgi:hypothetical protein